MGISTAAMMSIIALVLVVVLSCIDEDMHVGFLATSLGIIVGGIWGNTTGTKILQYFPVGLFMILVGCTYFFGMLQANGTLGKVTTYCIRFAKGNNVMIPVIIYLLTSVLTMIGPGNIVVPALMAPIAMAIATRIEFPAFLMTLIIVGAANGAGLSPFAPTGIISNGLIAKMANQLGIQNQLDWIAWKIHFNCMAAQGVVNIGGCFLLGGWAWAKRQKGVIVNLDDIAPEPEPFTRAQKLSLLMVVVLVALVILPALPFLKGTFPKPFMNVFANVGCVAFILSSVLMLLKAGNSRDAVKTMPWFVIMMVCCFTILIEVMDKSGGLNALVKMIGSVSGPITVHWWLGLITGVISAYSRSSGVVVPMFLPMVPGLRELTGADAIAMISSIDVGAHLVDTSPLSTLGALCIAAAGENENKSVLFRKLLIWGLSMSVVAGIVCALFFGVLNL